jgi:uncharacterized protein (TIGR00290 family)
MRTVLSWSSGKDSAWALHRLRGDPRVELVGLLTTINDAADRVSMHAVREELLRAQARALGLPVIDVRLPDPCSNEEYDRRMAVAVERMQADGVEAVAFGDLFLEDVRAYRERMLAGTGVEPIFPLWGLPTPALAREMVASGLRAVITCVDTESLDATFAGRSFDAALLDALPASVDPCGERGEFHTFVHAGPMFEAPLAVEAGEVVDRGRFVFADVRMIEHEGSVLS